MAWTNIAKPTGSSYTRLTFEGKIEYDDSSAIYDSSTIFYDGVNQTAYTNVAKPTGSTVIRTGMTTGLLIPLTFSTDHTIETKWTNVIKPT